VANTFIKTQQIVRAAMLLLQREIVLPRLIWTQPGNAFVGQLDDTVTLAVPAILTARTRTMRSATALQADDLTETKVGVKLDTHVYQLLNISDEQLTLDIVDFAAQVLNPQMRAVAEGLENVIAAALAAATPFTGNIAVAGSGATPSEPYNVAVDAAKALNDMNVPRAGRVLLLGSALEAFFLKSDKLSRVNESGTDTALRDARITRVAGFDVIGSNAIDPNVGYAFDRFAIATAVVAPSLPEGASMKERVVDPNGIGLRFLRDYNPTNSTGPVDRSLVDAFAGAKSVEQPPPDNPAGAAKNRRLVKLVFTP
jgi:hypothetical protein